MGFSRTAPVYPFPPQDYEFKEEYIEQIKAVMDGRDDLRRAEEELSVACEHVNRLKEKVDRARGYVERLRQDTLMRDMKSG